MFDMLSLPYRGVLVFICVSAVLFAIVYIVPLPTAQEKYLPFEEIPCPPRFAEPRPVCPEAELVVVRGLQKSGTTWLEYLVEALIREHCQETGECETWGQPNDIGFDRGSTGRNAQRVRLKAQGCEWRFNASWKHMPVPLPLPRGMRVLYILRDPRDGVVSRYYYRTLQSRLTLEEFFHMYFDERLQALARDVHNALWGGALVLQYELLHAQPEAEARRVAHYLGFAASPRTLRAALQRSSFESMRLLEDEGRLRGSMRVPPTNDSLRATSNVKVREGRPRAYLEHMAQFPGLVEWAEQRIQALLPPLLADLFLRNATICF